MKSIYVSDNPFLLRKKLLPFLKSYRPLVVTSPTVRRHVQGRIKKIVGEKIWKNRIEIPDREQNKNSKSLELLYQKLIQKRADRRSLLLLVGGGVVGDLGGFAAATYLRGIPYLQFPTTLIAQTDSAIGGKVGIDLLQGKNLVGSFYQPKAVFCDTAVLKTLPPREWRAGLAEVVKYGLIQDPALIEKLQRKKINVGEIVIRSVRIKSAIVAQDERETKGKRRLLNFGHTFGHALERLTHYRRYRHGEAVAIGMVIAAKISEKLGFCSKKSAHEVEKILKSLGLPIKPPRFSRKRWLSALQVDKKNVGDQLHFVFLKRTGAVVVRPVAIRRLVDLL